MVLLLDILEREGIWIVDWVLEWYEVGIGVLMGVVAVVVLAELGMLVAKPIQLDLTLLNFGGDF